MTDALDIAVTGGEQDCELATWRHMIDMRAVDIVQPDILYLGGISRTLEVCRMAKAAGLPVTPHSANLGLVTLFTMHLLRAIEGAGKYLEFSIEGADYYPWQEGLFVKSPYQVEGWASHGVGRTRLGHRDQPGMAGQILLSKERAVMTDNLLKHVQQIGTLPGLPDRHFIDGAWRPSAAGRMMESFDPGRAAPHAEFSAGDADDAAIAVECREARRRGRLAARAAERARPHPVAEQLS